VIGASPPTLILEQAMPSRPASAIARVIVAVIGLAAASVAAIPAVATPPLTLAAAVTYTVNSTADTPDADVGTAKCADAHARCSLRAAIMQSNFHAGADTIVVPAGTFKLTRKGDEDSAILGDLDITDSLTVKGAGSAKTIIDGNGGVTGDRVVQVLATATHVTIAGLTLEHGRRTATFDEGGGLFWSGGGSALALSDVVLAANSAYYGGGAFIAYSASGDSVDLNHVVIRSNTATAAAGGGLAVDLGTNAASFRLRNSHVYANTAYEGGGVYIGGTVPSAGEPIAISSTEINGNHAVLSAGLESHAGTGTTPLTLDAAYLHGNAATANGGGIGNYGYLVVRGSTISANTAVMRAGGEYAYPGSVTYLIDTTISANTTPGTGGGIYEEKFLASIATVVATDVTFASNAAATDGTFHLDAGTAASVTNTLIAKGPSGANCSGALNSATTSFADDASCGFGAGDSAVIKLSSLALHGGHTPTRVPLAGSAGIDAGTTLVSPATDQRGIARPTGSGTDAGAVEVCGLKPAAPKLLKPVSGASTSLRRVSLDWSTVACVQGYKVVIRRGSTSGTVVQSVPLVGPSALLTTTLARGHLYYWRVAAVGDRGATNSAWRHFRVK
jgi:CSLREA domain-containing protein